LHIQEEENEDTLVELAATTAAAATPAKLKKVSFARFFPGKYEDEEIWPVFRGEETVRTRLIEASLAEKEERRRRGS
jgi:hypothetical protein